MKRRQGNLDLLLGLHDTPPSVCIPPHEAVKFFIMNKLKPNRVPIQQFFVQVEQLNSYLKNLPN